MSVTIPLASDIPLVVSEIASPLPKRCPSHRTLFRLWYNNTTVALLSASAGVIMVEVHEGVPEALADYLLEFKNRNQREYDLTIVKYFQHFLKKMEKE